MPGKVKVRILSARGLPVMDRSSDLADAFAEKKRMKFGDENFIKICKLLCRGTEERGKSTDFKRYTVKLGNTVYKTEVYKKSLNPVWNSDWYRFEADDEELQQETLQLRIMDYDTYTAHDAIGKVNISLNCLLTHDAPSKMTGWFPIYDTIHGIRGEIEIIVKVDFFVDANRFRQSSCGVQFFNTPSVPSCYRTVAFLGFVEELVVNDDPEYQWIGTFRTPRSTNEARQRLFQKLSGELQRKIGLKVLDLGGNAVIGYQQYFDLEGESGIVVRGIGTCVFLQKIYASSSPSTPTHFAMSPRDSTGAQELFMTCDLAKSFPPPRQRKRTSSSESDGGSPLKDSSGSGDAGSLSGLANPKIPRQATWRKKNIDEFEFPFFTLTKFPPGFLKNIGGVVSARSVKLLDRINNPDEPETRDSWWSEIRTEIRSHTKALGCHAVVGYSESSTICDELIVLSATGTAACVNLEMDLKSTVRPTKTVGQTSCQLQPESEVNTGHSNSGPTSSLYLSVIPSEDPIPGLRSRDACSICHIPYMDSDIPMPVYLTKCLVCKQAKVPDMLFSTIEMPSDLQLTGKGCLLQGRICRSKRKEKGEANAELISNILPFLEYELHRQLTNKLKIKGMNALFGLQIQVSVGEVMIIALGTATAVYLSCLPPPPLLRVVGKTSSTDEERRLRNIQKKILDVSNKNRARYELNEIGDSSSFGNIGGSVMETTSDESYEEKASLDPSFGSREAFVVEVDDKQDEDVITFLFDTPTPEGFYCGTTEVVPGITQSERRMQMITAVKRIAVCDDDIEQSQLITRLFDSIIKSFWFKLRGMSPCSISNIRFDLEIPMADNVQVAVNAYVVALQRQQTQGLLHQVNRIDLKENKKAPGLLTIGKAGAISSECEDLQFQIDEVSVRKPQESSGNTGSSQLLLENRIKLKLPQLPFRPKVEITPMFSVPGGCIERYLGNVNLFLIRESLSIRENGGLNYFIQVFIGEVHAVLRAHVLALGGNALISFRMNKMVLLDSPHKNQGQILLNVCGDVVEVAYKEDNLSSFENRPAKFNRSTSCCEETVSKKQVHRRSASINDPTL